MTTKLGPFVQVFMYTVSVLGNFTKRNIIWHENLKRKYKLLPATSLKKVGTEATKGWKSKKFWKDSAGRTSIN